MITNAHQYAFEATTWDFSDHILTITLNRPAQKNAINQQMANELMYLFTIAKEDPEVRVVILGANGDIFCAGGDLRQMSGTESTNSVPDQGPIHEISTRLRNICKPVVCVVNGPVMAGGLMLVCNATHAIASSSATASAPEILRGLWPHMVMAGLFRVMPRRLALDFIMRGYKMSASEASHAGLFNQVVAESELSAVVDALAKELAAKSPSTMRIGLEAFYAQEQMAFDEAIPFLMDQLARTLATSDAQEGIAAFLQKREPEFTGH